MIYPNIIVQAGESAVRKTQKKILKANLGSCIGIAIWDDVNEVGGILHTLLAKPYSNFTDIPEKYASTGLPKFIDELVKEGGNIDNFKAAVAGGSFPSSPDSFDFLVNIGGKTSEKVSSILKHYKIPITKWETGGFFSCSLNLNLETFHVEIKPFIDDISIEEEIEHNAKEIKKLDAEEIKIKVNEIKPIPQIILKIIRMLHSSYLGMKDIAAEIKKDQVLSAKAIKLCNSAIFKRVYPISTIDEAIIQLGEDNLVKNILNYYLHKLYSMNERGYSLCQGGLFHHSLATAIISEKLSVFTNLESPTKAYSAGLLHDIGKVLLDQTLADARPFFYRDLSKNECDILNLESNTLGVNHCLAGKIIAQEWKFPKALEETIEFHHYPEDAKNFSSLVTIVHISDIIASWMITGILPETTQLNKTEKILKRFSLTPDKIYDFIEWLPLKDLTALFPLQLFESFGGKDENE